MNECKGNWQENLNYSLFRLHYNYFADVSVQSDVQLIGLDRGQSPWSNVQFGMQQLLWSYRSQVGA